MIWACASVFLILPTLAWLFQLIDRRETNAMLHEFMERWPNRCPICWHHRMGVVHGHEQPGTKPGEHDCIERGHDRA
jgi:hypothetical protein